MLQARLFWVARRNGMPWRPFLCRRLLGGMPAKDAGGTQSQEDEMPKLKTKSGVKKRFKLSATGKVMAGAVGKRHRLSSHNGKYIRQNRGTSELAKPDADRVKLWIPYGLK